MNGSNRSGLGAWGADALCVQEKGRGCGGGVRQSGKCCILRNQKDYTGQLVVLHLAQCCAIFLCYLDGEI